MQSTIEAMYDEFQDTLNLLSRNGEISLQSALDGNFRKSLLLAAASHFEFLVISKFLSFTSVVVDEDELLQSAVRIRIIERKYHDLFDWKTNNANKFYSIFGENFKNKLVALSRNDPEFAGQMTSFMQIGSDRNRLVHQNYASFVLEKTSSEIYKSYNEGIKFIERVFKELTEFHLASKRSRNRSRGVINQYHQHAIYFSLNLSK